jgi:hypothetical protein
MPMCFHLFIQHLEAVIKAKIPSIIAMINKTVDEIEAELDRLGRPIGGDAGVSNTYSHKKLDNIFCAIV